MFLLINNKIIYLKLGTGIQPFLPLKVNLIIYLKQKNQNILFKLIFYI